MWSLSGPARQDLDDFWFDIAGDDAAAADQMISLIVERFEMLARQPLIGEACPEVLPDLRNIPVRPHVIYYVIRAEEIVITRFLHGEWDVRRQF